MEFEALRDSLVKILGVYKDEVTLDADLAKDLGADSLDLYQVVLNMQQAFGYEIVPEDLSKIKTVQDAVNYMRKMRPEDDK